MNLAIRGFAGLRKLFEDRITIDPEALEDVMAGLAAKHIATITAHKLHTIEIEFLDEPDQSARFFRIGSDPSMMVEPIEVDWSKPVDLSKWKG